MGLEVMLAAWLECDTAWDAEAVMKAEQARARPQLLAGLRAAAMWGSPGVSPSVALQTKVCLAVPLVALRPSMVPMLQSPHSVLLQLPHVSMGILAGDTARHLCVPALL